MNIDKEKLKALAEAALTGDWYEAGDLRYEDRKTGDIHGLHHDDDRFIAAAGPTTVLALLVEIKALHKDAERSKRMLLDACVSIGSIGEALGLDMDADADMMIGTACDLIDGLNRIIKECPLGSPGFAIATEVLGELGVQQEAQP